MKTAPRRNVIMSIKVIHDFDDAPDTSTIGEFTDDLDDDCILRSTGEFIADLRQNDNWEAPSRGREYRAFRPYAGGEKAGSAYWRTYGMQDFNRLEGLARGEWHFIGIRAVAEVLVGGTVQTIASSGLHGVESDSGAAYLREVAGEELSQLGHILVDPAVPYLNPPTILPTSRA